MTSTIAFVNHKGGTGKTSVCVQTAAALARAGYRVLVVDLDPQANASRRLRTEHDPANPRPSVSEAITGGLGAGQHAVIRCGWDAREADRIDVMPARTDLLNREAEAGQVGAVRRLAKALTGWTDVYDFVLIDTRPDLGHLVQQALAAANHAVLVTNATYDGHEGAIRIADFITINADDLHNPHLNVVGVVITQVESTNANRFQIEGMHQHFGELVWNLHTQKIPGVDATPPHIPHWTRFAEADAAAVPLSAWNDRTATTTVALFDQVAARLVNATTTAAEPAA